MKIRSLENGYLRENCYLITKNSDTLIVDPGSELSKLQDLILSYSLNIKGILITHNHDDHTHILNDLLEIYNVPVSNIDNKIIVKPFEYEIIETKGHTSDSVSFYFKAEKVIFTGDFLFKNDIGRYDLPSSSENDMKASLELIKNFDKDLIIYPGHGESTTLKNELLNNFYLGDNYAS